MQEPRETSRLTGPLGSKGDPSDQWPRPVHPDGAARVLAVCEPGALEDRLRGVAKTLGQQVRFFRRFPDALDELRDQFYEIVLVARLENGMPAREFVREARKINDDAVVVLAAPGSEYEQLLGVMVEGAYDFLPRDADDNQLKLMLARAMDHSRLRRKSSRLERALDARTSSLRQRLQELAMLNEMTQDMSSISDLDEMLRRALRRILDAFGSECGSFLILEPETDELVVRAAEGRGARDLIGLRRKLGEGISGEVARGRHPVLVTDIQKDSRFRSNALNEAGVRRYRSPSFVAVPLIHHGRLLGEMNITEKGAREPFTQDDLRLLSIFGGHVASAINGALTAQELKRANETLREDVCSTRENLDATNHKLDQAEGVANAIVQSLPVAMAVFDAALTVTCANDAAKRLLGLERGDSLTERPAAADLAHAAAEAAERGSTKTLTTESRLESCNSGACLNVVVAPLRVPNGDPSGGTIVATPGNCPLMRFKKKEEVS